MLEFVRFVFLVGVIIIIIYFWVMVSFGVGLNLYITYSWIAIMY